MADPRLSMSISARAVEALREGVSVQVSIPAQPNQPERRAFHAVPPASVAKYWLSSLGAALEPAEADKRLARLGPNKLTEKAPPSLLSRVLAQVSDSTVLALLGAAVIATVLSI